MCQKDVKSHLSPRKGSELDDFPSKTYLENRGTRNKLFTKLLESGHAQIWVPCRPFLRQLLLALILGIAE